MHRIAVIGLGPILFVISVAAQAATVYTETEFLSALDERHPSFVTHAHAVALAQARVRQVAFYENPELGIEREGSSAEGAQIDWTLSWQLPEVDRRLRIEAREAELEGAAAQLDLDYASLRLAMRQAYADWALAVARQRRIAVEAERLEELAARESVRAARGESSGLEARRLGLRASSLTARLALLAADTEQALAKVRSWVPDLPSGAEPELPPVPTIESSAQGHPLLRAAKAELDAARLDREAARRFVRSPEVSVGWHRRERAGLSAEGSRLGIGWSLPLFDRRQAQRAAAEATVSAAQASLETARRELSALSRAAATNYNGLAAALQRAREAGSHNEKTVVGALAAFRLGEAGLIDLLDVLDSVAAADLAVLDLYEAVLAAHREVERLSGPWPEVPRSMASTEEEVTP